MRWVVGDVQGCVREFERLLEAVHFDPSRDELWSVGDLINRGPESLATLRLWRDIGGRGVIGDHEVYALLAASGAWPRKAERDTLEALYGAPDAETLLASLRALPVLAFLRGEDCPDAWIVHAGVHPSWADLHTLADRSSTAEHDDVWLQSHDVKFATRVRCCAADGTMSQHVGKPEECEAPFRPWDQFYEGKTFVVHGHWAWRRHYRGPMTMGLDDACVHGGTLTAWCQQDRIVQIPAARDYSRSARM